VLEIGVHDHHPSPRTEDEAESLPSSTQCSSEQRKALERQQGALHARLGVRRQAVSEDQSLEVLDRRRGELDLGHRLELVDWDRLARSSLLEPELGALEGAGDPVEKLDHMTGVHVRLVDCVREEGARERPFLGVRALGQERELRSALGTESDIQTTALARHSPTVVETRRFVYQNDYARDACQPCFIGAQARDQV
jgi:hypothetical protein